MSIRSLGTDYLHINWHYFMFIVTESRGRVHLNLFTNIPI